LFYNRHVISKDFFSIYLGSLPAWAVNRISKALAPKVNLVFLFNLKKKQTVLLWFWYS